MSRHGAQDNVRDKTISRQPQNKRAKHNRHSGRQQRSPNQANTNVLDNRGNLSQNGYGLLLLFWTMIHECVFPHSELRRLCINFCKQPTCTSPGGVGLCNLIFSQFPLVHQHDRTPTPEQKNPTLTTPTLGNWLFPKVNPKPLFDISLFGKSYPLSIIVTKVPYAQ